MRDGVKNDRIIGDLDRIPRLINVSGAKISRRRIAGKVVVTASLTLSRYVATINVAPDEQLLMEIPPKPVAAKATTLIGKVASNSTLKSSAALSR